MKRTLIILAAAATVLCACNKRELVIDKTVNDEISFRTVIGASSKSTEYHSITVGNLDSFNVWAYKNAAGGDEAYFKDVDYTLIGGSGVSGDPRTYTSNPKYYWPSDDTPLTFYAYSPKESANGLARTDFKKWSAVQQVFAADQPDFIVAVGQGRRSGNQSGLNINFRHAMSKVSLMVRNTNPGLKFKITNWKIAYLYDKADFAIAEENTNGNNPGTNPAYVLNPADWTYAGATQAVTNESKNGTDLGTPFTAVSPTNDRVAGFNDFVIIPQLMKDAGGKYSGTDVAPDASPFAGSYIAVKMQILTDLGAEVAAEQWCCWPVSTQFKPGYHYTYKIDLADGGYYEKNQDGDEELDPIIMGAEIKFVDLTVDEWVPEEGTHQTAFNKIALTMTAVDMSGTALPEAGTLTPASGAEYDFNEVAHLKAEANSGYVFVKWSDGVTSAERDVVVTEPKEFKAMFAPVASVTIAQTVDGAAGTGGTAAQEKTNSWETENYIGQSIRLVATPDAMHDFTKWTKTVDAVTNDFSTDATTAAFTVSDAAATYTALFTTKPAYAITATATDASGVAKAAWGTVTVDGAVKDVSGKFFRDSQVNLTAAPTNDGHCQFVKWEVKTGADVWAEASTNLAFSIIATADAEYRAVFTYNE